MILYAWCLSPTVSVTGDCGELIAASWRGGVAHPSGYALWSLLSRVFAQVFAIGEVALRYNLFSAVCGAATVGVVALCVARLISPREYSDASSNSSLWAASGAGLLLAGFYFFGAQCVIAEVYALNALVMALTFWCALSWKQDKFFGWLAALAALLGLSFNSHLSSVFIWPGILIFLAPQLLGKRVFTTRRVLALLFFCALGFSPTLSLPLRARTFPQPQTEVIGGKEYSWFTPLDWGHPNNFARWKKHVTVGQYDSLLWKPLQVKFGGRNFHLLQPTQTPMQAVGKFLTWLGFLAISFVWCAPLLIVGAIAAFKRDASPDKNIGARGRRLGAMLFLTFVLNVGVAMFYNVDNVFDIANFLFPAYLVLALWTGIGLDVVLRAAARNARVLALCRVALVGAIILQWFLFTQTGSFRGNTNARDLALERANAAQQLQNQTGRAPHVLMLTDDTLFPFWYVQKVLGKAPDASTPWGTARTQYIKRGRLLDVVARLQKNGPVALTQWDEKVDARFPYVPLNENGSLWLASNNVLPPPATRIEVRKISPVLRAGFVQREARRVEARGFKIEFVLPNFASQKPITTDTKNHAQQIGFIEVLVAPRGALSTPTPQIAATLPISKTARCLVVPQNARAGEVFQTLIPIQIPIEMPTGDCDVWARLTRSPRDANTPWTRSGNVQIIVK